MRTLLKKKSSEGERSQSGLFSTYPRLSPDKALRIVQEEPQSPTVEFGCWTEKTTRKLKNWSSPSNNPANRSNASQSPDKNLNPFPQADFNNLAERTQLNIRLIVLHL